MLDDITVRSVTIYILNPQVHIDAGKEDCYHQYVQAGATFYVSFSVSM